MGASPARILRLDDKPASVLCPLVAQAALEFKPALVTHGLVHTGFGANAFLSDFSALPAAGPDIPPTCAPSNAIACFLLLQASSRFSAPFWRAGVTGASLRTDMTPRFVLPDTSDNATSRVATPAVHALQ